MLSARFSKLRGCVVVGTCPDLVVTFDRVEHHPPDLVLVEAGLARMPEFETMTVLFRCLNVKWATLSSTGTPDRDGSVTIPVSSGAIDAGWDDTRLLEALRRCIARPMRSPETPRTGLLRSEPARNAGIKRSEKVILIGSSTGGIDALLQVLGGFPIDCPPTLVVQHTGAGFSTGLARLLDRAVAPQVREATDGEPITVGSVLIAPGSTCHLHLDTSSGWRCRLVEGEKKSGHRPSVDRMFLSAVPIARQVCAAVLTGMGRDGAEGLLALRRAGARTIGQDKATSVVYGMPRQAYELGAVDQQLPIGRIGAALLAGALAGGP